MYLEKLLTKIFYRNLETNPFYYITRKYNVSPGIIRRKYNVSPGNTQKISSVSPVWSETIILSSLIILFPFGLTFGSYVFLEVDFQCSDDKWNSDLGQGLLSDVSKL